MAQRTLKEQLEEAEQHSKEVLDQLLDESTTVFPRAGRNEDGCHS